jgi:hypothetical protein
MLKERKKITAATIEEIRKRERQRKIGGTNLRMI